MKKFKLTFNSPVVLGFIFVSLAVLILGVVTLVMLIVATLLKKRDYAMAAAVTLILVALYLTRDLWMSIAWWVYLFVAGVGLVIFAIKKEKAEK